MPQIQITIDVPPEVVDAINTWRLSQTTDDDPPVLVHASNVALLESIIEDGVLRILDVAPTAAIAAEIAKITAAKAAIEVLRDNAISMP